MNGTSLTSANTIPDICLHLNGVAPAPRRDFFDLKVSLKEQKVKLVKWIITPRQEEGKLRPTEFVDSFEDFPSDIMLRHLQPVFGKEIVQHIEGIILGKYDWLIRLPDQLLIRLLTFVNLEDIEVLSKVCRRLRDICSSDALWKEIFCLNMPSLISSEIQTLAEEKGWKSVFYSRIFERRRRAKHLAQSVSGSSASESSTPRLDTPLSLRSVSAVSAVSASPPLPPPPPPFDARAELDSGVAFTISQTATANDNDDDDEEFGDEENEELLLGDEEDDEESLVG